MTRESRGDIAEATLTFGCPRGRRIKADLKYDRYRGMQTMVISAAIAASGANVDQSVGDFDVLAQCGG
jgi:hypothetical protein